MSNCLYCQYDNPAEITDCHNCGMFLPNGTQRSEQQRERRFIWFCAALTAFCLSMIIWLPRTLF